MHHFSFNLLLMALFYLCFLQTKLGFLEASMSKDLSIDSCKDTLGSDLQTIYVCISSMCIVQQTVQSCP